MYENILSISCLVTIYMCIYATVALLSHCFLDSDHTFYVQPSTVGKTVAYCVDRVWLWTALPGQISQRY